MKRQSLLLAFVCVAVAAASALAQTEGDESFHPWDRNKDGRLARDEVPQHAQAGFEQRDADGDGFITREEFAAFQKKAAERRPPRARAGAIAPTHADVRYGPHERNVLDLYLAESDRPTPLVLYIHGGGFRGGDKRTVGAVNSYLDAGFSVAAINYRLTDTAPAPAAYLDCARALQFLRHNAERWNLDPKLVASTGGSAGAGTSMWLAFHDDLADPDSEDPVARQSTRLTCIAVNNGQSSYDPKFAEKIGIPRPNFERHDFFLPFYGIERDEIDTPRAYQLYEQAAAITYVSQDDPPALLMYSYANEEVTEKSPLGLIVHHPKFGIALKEKLDELGIQCIVQYRDPQSGGLVRHDRDKQPVSALDFIREQFQQVDHLQPRKEAGTTTRRE